MGTTPAREPMTRVADSGEGGSPPQNTPPSCPEEGDGSSAEDGSTHHLEPKQNRTGKQRQEAKTTAPSLEPRPNALWPTGGTFHFMIDTLFTHVFRSLNLPRLEGLT